jgi:hypothetical protein
MLEELWYKYEMVEKDIKKKKNKDKLWTMEESNFCSTKIQVKSSLYVKD